MKFLLAAINAKYIHSNLGIYSLKAYAEAQRQEAGGTREEGDQTAFWDIELAEYTINNQPEEILKDIYRRKPAVIGFSCYIWNISCVRRLLKDIPKVLPDVHIWLGGPEVSFDGETLLQEEKQVAGIMTGEGEQTFSELLGSYERKQGSALLDEWKQIPGLVFRGGCGQTVTTAARPLMDLDKLPFPYETLEHLEHRIIYYESSRGCPFRCSYCLSSVDKSVRFRSLRLVMRELDFFLEKKVPQVKFVDRTFNCKKSHTMAIWKHILEHDNGITNFHFEISADLLDEEELAVLKQMRPGLVQLEIGVQTTFDETLTEIRRTTNLQKLRQRVASVRQSGNIHQHLDLIAGLPYEGLERFAKSFNDVYRMRPDQLQLGFLKVLKGSYMEEMAEDYGLLFSGEPPYEVLSTKWMSYEELLKLKATEDMVEVYYNSGQFTETIKEMEKRFRSPFEMFGQLAEYYERQGLSGRSHSRLARYEILFDFLRETDPAAAEVYRDSLTYDLYLRENAKSRPFFAADQTPYKEEIKDFFKKERERGWDPGKQAHLEILGSGEAVLFDYSQRDPLNHNAKACSVPRFPRSYVAIDLETTGLDPKWNKIIEIAAVKVLDGQVVEERSTFVDPHCQLTDHVRELTGICQEDLIGAPDVGQVIGDFVEFMGNLPLLGHNVLFDYSFLKHAAVNQEILFEKKGIDTLKLCRHFMDAEEKKNLAAACEHYQVTLEGHHRALEDARAAHRLFCAVLEAHKDAGPKLFQPSPLLYRAKKARPASKRQKEGLRELLKYHRINTTMQIDALSGNEISRMTDKIISKYGRIVKEVKRDVKHE